MIVQMRTVAQAARVAASTGAVHLPGMPGQNGGPRLSRRVDVGADFEVHRAAVESVSVLLKLFDDRGGELVEVPSGWTVTAAKFEVEWPAEPDRAALVRSHFGARRFAFNWALAQVKADLDTKAVDPGHESVRWDLGSLRKAWNRAKSEVAPWWATNSKECYSAGLADLAQALNNWSNSKAGKPKPRKGTPHECVTRDPSTATVCTQSGCLPGSLRSRCVCSSSMSGTRSELPSIHDPVADGPQRRGGPGARRNGGGGFRRARPATAVLLHTVPAAGRAAVRHQRGDGDTVTSRL
jgi:hypothetical protein